MTSPALVYLGIAFSQAAKDFPAFADKEVVSQDTEVAASDTDVNLIKRPRQVIQDFIGGLIPPPLERTAPGLTL